MAVYVANGDIIRLSAKNAAFFLVYRAKELL
jgi:hypothetical protein